jgi:nitroimidazol reductase NimA-like FMN-containing flavoprotein (pyridoxamine 5'-phosphate oxidase superfamily)
MAFAFSNICPYNLSYTTLTLRMAYRPYGEKGMNGEHSGLNHAKENSLFATLEPFDGLRFAVLATSDKGRPYASLIAFALTHDRGTLIFVTPKSTRKYRNLIGQQSVSVLIDNRSQTPEDLSNAEAATLVGTAGFVTTSAKKTEYREIFIKKHPRLASFVDDPENELVAVTIEQVVHVQRFLNVTVWPVGENP